MAFGIASLAGIVAGAIPKGLEYFERKQDNKQELAILDKTLAAQKEIENTKIDLSRIKGADESYQASLKHDTKSAQHKANTWLGGALMDLVNVWRSIMRPGIVSTFMGLYVIFKISTIYAITGGEASGQAVATAILAAWGSEDWALLELGVSYYITNRGVEKLSGKT